MKLLVGSVYARSPKSLAWYKLQIAYLDRTVGPHSYDHIVFTTAKNPTFPTRSQVIPILKRNMPHARGLNAISHHFAQVSTKYDHFLVLDSDAFPIIPDWINTLNKNMRHKQWAAVIRTENLETYPHPCTVYIRKPMMIKMATENQLIFGRDQHYLLNGGIIRDNCCQLPISKLYPLIRTNVWNPHPTLCAVYGNLFYHHGAGSRAPKLRVVKSGKLKNVIDDQQHYDLSRTLLRRIHSNPDKFLGQLRGLNSL